MASGELEVLRCESSLWSGHCCARCRAELGRIINRGANCRACRERICMSCREYSTATSAPEWLCIRCYKDKIESLEPTKEWIVDFLTPENMKYSKNETKLGRSLTFKDPSPWSAVRGSPELRAYSSMPRGSAPWWPHRGTAGSRPSAGRARQSPAACCVRATAETTTTTTDDDGDQATVAADVTVHLVDTCGRVIDIRTSEPTAAMTKTTTTTADGALPSSPDGSERDRPKRSAVPTKCCPSQAQDDNHLKHIPPGVTPPRSRRFLRRGEPFLAEEICGVVTGNRTKEDYRLVFLNGADWSSDDGGGGRQTSSSLSADDDCDWDYFMAGLDDDNSQSTEPLQQQQQQQQQQRWQQSTGGAGTANGGGSGSGGGGAGDGDDDQLTGCGSGGDVGSSKPSETDAPATTFVPVVLPFPVFVPVPIVIQSERAQHTLTAAAFANVLTEYFRDRNVDGNKRHVNDDGAPAGGGFVVADMPEPPGVAATAAVVDDGGGAVLTMYSARAAGLDAKPSAAVCADDDRDAEIGYYSTSSSSASSTSDDSDGARHVAMSYDVNDSPNDDIIDDDIDDDDDGCNVKLSSILDAAAVAAVKCAAASNSSASDEFSGTESMEQIPVDESAATTAGSLSGRFTSLITITRDDDSDERRLSTVNVVANDTTKVMMPDVAVKDEGGRRFKLTLDTSEPADESEVTVVTGGATLSSAVVALEEGLADDDSWVEEDLDRDDFRNESSEGEQHMSFEDEPPEHGRRSALDFTLHTIVEESCEESETESDHRNNQTELEKYFFFGLCGQQDRDEIAVGGTRVVDTFSETSSIVSDGLESLPDSSVEPSSLLQPPPSPSHQMGGGGATDTSAVGSRLERYFLTEFMGFDRPDSDGSVGSDSPEHSPEQRRKRLVRARGTGRQHSSSLDNVAECCEQQTAAETTTTAMTTVQPLAEHDDASTSSSDSNNELDMLFEKTDGQFDTVKRGKKKKRCVVVTAPPLFGVPLETDSNNADVGREEATEQQRITDDNVVIGDALEENITVPPAITTGSTATAAATVTTTSTITTTTTKTSTSIVTSTAAAGGLSRTDSFNDWSSDEETNLMMCKMRAFFKTMLADRPGPEAPGETSKPPQLVKFESELTRLMKTVPGIRDEQVKEIVEYLSSEDTWSDSYDSSDYTSSDLETTGSAGLPDDNGDAAFVYQKLMASLRRIDVPSSDSSASRNSPPLVTKVMQHIGSRLVALMHAVSESPGAPLHAASSGYRHHYQHQHQNDHHHQHHHHHHHRRSSRRRGRTSTAAMTIPVTIAADEDDDGDGGGIDVRYGVGVGVGGGGVVDGSPLPRSKSHDPLLEELARQEASDNERFSWRGSFESTLMMSDSRTRLTSSGESCATLAAKRRSAGDLLIKSANSSREQLDRVRSCGSIGGSVEDRIWRNGRRRGSVPDSGDSAGDSDSGGGTVTGHGSKSTTLPRNLQQASAATVAAVVGSSSNTNSLPRLSAVPAPAPSPLTGIYKAHSVHQFNVKSARYRPPGYKNAAAATPPRREYNNNNRRRTTTQHPATSSSLSTSSLPSSSTASAATSMSSNNINNNFNYNCGFQSPSTDATGVDNNRTLVGAIGNGTELPTNLAYTKPEDELEKLPHRSTSSLGVARSDSMASVYSGAGDGRYGTVPIRGEVEFGLQYNYKAAQFEINIKHCRDLAAADSKRNRSDPYVKVYLLPDKSKAGKRKTRVKKHTMNPIFDEVLKYSVPLEELNNRTLWLSVWHSDMFGRNNFLGEVRLPLENKIFDDTSPKFYPLQERTEPLDDTYINNKGEIIVGLKCVPADPNSKKRTKGTFLLLVKDAKNLQAAKSNGSSDPFCKSYLLPDKGRNSKQKTNVARKTCNPSWNQTLTYRDVSLEELADKSLELTVWDHDRLGSNEFLGGVRLSLGSGMCDGKSVDWMDSNEKEIALWQRMLDRPNFWVEGCLTLRPSLELANKN